MQCVCRRETMKALHVRPVDCQLSSGALVRLRVKAPTKGPKEALRVGSARFGKWHLIQRQSIVRRATNAGGSQTASIVSLHRPTPEPTRCRRDSLNSKQSTSVWRPSRRQVLPTISSDLNLTTTRRKLADVNLELSTATRTECDSVAVWC